MFKILRAAPVACWLFICCGMIFAMALLGAVTRLTESGLSITDWNPIAGALPPLTPDAWIRAFADYKTIPQYRLHPDMTLDQFKSIFFWEWLHRLWGRLIGVVFVVPLILFWARKRITRAAGLKFAVIFALGGVQGFIGWFMVQSGLAVRTSVSPYRLALHLGFALAIYCILLWAALDALPVSSPKTRAAPALIRHGWIALAFLALTMTWGAFVAGLHAGEAYNTWPLMDGHLFPENAETLQPAWLNMFENTAFAQFIHRWLGPTTMLVMLGWVARCWNKADAAGQKGLAALGCMALAQVALGIATLLSHAEIILAVLHQAGAVTLLSLLCLNLHRLSGTTRSRK